MFFLRCIVLALSLLPLIGFAAAPLELNENIETRESLDLSEMFSYLGLSRRIEGLPSAVTYFNGQSSFAVPNGHALSWADVPEGLITSVESYKSLDVSMPSGGLNGMNIRTRLPLDSESNKLIYVSGAEKGELAQQWGPFSALLYSRVFTAATSRFGYQLSGRFKRSWGLSDELGVEPYIARDDLGDQTVFMPRGLYWRRSEEEQEQKGVSLAFQWQYKNLLNLSWQSWVSSDGVLSERWTAGLRDSETGLVPDQDSSLLQFSRDGVFQSGAVASNSWRGDVPGDGVRMNGTTSVLTKDNGTQAHSFNLRTAINDSLAMNLGAQYTRSNTQLLDFTVYTSRYMDSMYLQVGAAPPRFITDDAQALSDPADYFWNAAMDHLEKGRGQQFSVELDFEWQNLGGDKWLSAIRWGVSRDRRSLLFQDTGYNWGSLSDNWNLPLQYINEASESYVDYIHFQNYSGPNNPSFVLPDADFVRDFSRSSQALTELKSGKEGEGWIPDRFSYEDDTRLARNETALYALLYWQPQIFSNLESKASSGLRLVRSEVDARGFGEYKLLEDEGNKIADEEQVFGDGSFFEIDTSTAALDILPSFSFSQEMAESLDLNLSLSKGLIKPSISQQQSYAEVGAETETVNLDGGDSKIIVKRWFGRAGSPGLKNVDVRQFDAQLDWHHQHLGSFYNSSFYKQLKNNIVTEVAIEEMENNGELRRVEIERLRNSGDASIKGYELGWSRYFNSAPSVYIQSSFTRLLSRSSESAGGQRLPLEAVPDKVFRISTNLNYKDFGFSTEYRWRGEMLQSTINVDTNRPTWLRAQGQVNAKLNWQISKQLAVRVEGINLTQSTERKQYGAYQYENGMVDTNRYGSQWRFSERRWRVTAKLEL